MYIHLGEDTTINFKHIVAIIDLDNTTISRNTRDFLRKSEQSGIVVNVSAELPKSAVICEKEGKNLVYISPISPSTLLKRAQGKFTNMQEEL